ncbi:hypothetical protein ABBQ38_002593 [Trebouxia sp. C0009 RCD-2024]
MPPKQKGKSAAKKKGAKDAPAKLDDKDLLRRAEIEVACLQGLLQVKSQETLTARQHERHWRDQVAALQVSLENQRVDLQDITSNMQRQYKEMQEQLLKRGAAIETQAKALTAQLCSKDQEIASLEEKQVQQQRLHQNELAEMTKKQNILQSEFAEMLKDTVQHLHAQRKAAYAKVAQI